VGVCLWQCLSHVFVLIDVPITLSVSDQDDVFWFAKGRLFSEGLDPRLAFRLWCAFGERACVCMRACQICVCVFV
jgi:hypothetical protein